MPRLKFFSLAAAVSVLAVSAALSPSTPEASLATAPGVAVTPADFVTTGSCGGTYGCTPAATYTLEPEVANGYITYKLTPGSTTNPLNINDTTAWDRAGGVFFKQRVDLRQPFEVNAELNFDFENTGPTNRFGGADGIGFVFQTESSSTLYGGGGLGFGGFKPVVAVEFDTWKNAEAGAPWGDIHPNGTDDVIALVAKRHDSVSTQPATNHTVFGYPMTSPVVANTAPNYGQRVVGQLEDGQWKKARFTWTPSPNASSADVPNRTGTLAASIDVNNNQSFESDEIFSWEIDIEDFLGKSDAFIGITGSVGGAVSSNQVRFPTSAVQTLSTRINLPPEIAPSSPANVEILTGSGPLVLPFTLTDTDNATTLIQWGATATSSNPAVATVTRSNPALAGADVRTNLTITPLTVGTTTITLTATDADGATATVSFTVTVTDTARVNTPPTISSQADVSFAADADDQVFNFTLTDDLTSQNQWVISVTSSNAAVATASHVLNSATDLAVTVSPVAVGTTTITISATDADGATATQTFEVTVTPAASSDTPATYSGPVIIDVGDDGVSTPYLSNGRDPVRVTGLRLATVNRVLLGGKEAILVSVADDHFVILVPAGLAAGIYDLEVFSSFGKLSYQRAVVLNATTVGVITEGNACTAEEPSWWTTRISATQAKAYVKCPKPGVKYEVIYQAGGKGDYRTVMAITIPDEADSRQRFNEFGRYLVRTINMSTINRIRILVDGIESWKVRYNNHPGTTFTR